MVKYSVTYRCDRCGYKKTYTESAAGRSKIGDDGWTRIDQKDVCPKCSKAYERSMNNFWTKGQSCNTKGE